MPAEVEEAAAPRHSAVRRGGHHRALAAACNNASSTLDPPVKTYLRPLHTADRFLFGGSNVDKALLHAHVLVCVRVLDGD